MDGKQGCTNTDAPLFPSPFPFAILTYYSNPQNDYHRAAETMRNLMAQVMEGRKKAKKPGRKAELPVWHSLSLSRHFGVWVKQILCGNRQVKN